MRNFHFDYVASGLAHIDIFRVPIVDQYDKDGTGSVVLIQKFFRYLNGRNSHDFSVLFNAFVERSIGRKIHRLYEDHVKNIYSDSGGLQVITLGKQITPKLKELVYDVQSKYSNLGMCFDEIPVITSGERSDRKAVNDRFFDYTQLKEKARHTGRNIKEQIKYFESKDTACKPIIILQGNCYKTYCEWAEILLEEIGHENWSKIAAVSSGGAALGFGPLEDFKRAFVLATVPLPAEIKNKHYHILGVGSFKRLMPYVALMRSNHIQEQCVLSYDSTTHTGNVNYGHFYELDVGIRRMGREKNEKFHRVLTQINQLMRDMDEEEVTEETFYDVISVPQNWKDKYGDQAYNDTHYRAEIGFFMAQLLNFTHDVQKFATDDEYYRRKAIQTKMYQPLARLQECKDAKDLQEWERQFKSKFPSSPVVSKEFEINNLDSFFSDEEVEA